MNVNVSSTDVLTFLAVTLTLISSMSPFSSLFIINFLWVGKKLIQLGNTELSSKLAL